MKKSTTTLRAEAAVRRTKRALDRAADRLEIAQNAYQAAQRADSDARRHLLNCQELDPACDPWFAKG